MIPMTTPLLGLRALGALAFSPLDLGPYFWLNADQQAEANNADITNILDQSGNARDFTQATSGNRAHLKHSIMNGKKVIQFGENSSGVAGQKMYSRANTFLSGLTAGHIFILQRSKRYFGVPAGGGNDGGVVGEMHNHGSNWNHLPYTNGDMYTGLLSGTRRQTNPLWELNQWHIVDEWSATNDWGIRVNGFTRATSASNTVGLKSATRYIGCGDNASSAAWFAGQVSDIIIFPSKLSDADAEKVRRWLAEKAGITHVLPLAHPGKTFPNVTSIRLRAYDTSGSNDAFGVREIRGYANTAGTGTNLFTGGTQISSHNDASFPRGNAFNGNTADFWTSLGVAAPSVGDMWGHWIGYQFASPTSIGSLVVRTRAEFNETPNRYMIDISQDSGATWKTMKAGGGITGNIDVTLACG